MDIAISSMYTFTRSLHLTSLPSLSPLSSDYDSDVVIIGSGIVGSSLAYHLTATHHTYNTQKIPSVTVIERGSVGCAASGLSAGTLWSTGYGNESSPLHTEYLCADSLEVYREIENKGYNCGLTRNGIMVLACTKDEDAFIQEEYENLTRHGHTCSYISSSEGIVQVDTALRGGCATSALFAPLGGYVDPLLATTAISDAARAQGAKVFEGQNAVTVFRLGPFPVESDIEDKTRRRYAVYLDDGNLIFCSHLVAAGGIFCGSPLHSLGIYVPVMPVKGTMWESNSEAEVGSSSLAVKHVIYAAESELAWSQRKESFPDCPNYCTHDRNGFQRVRHCYGRPRGDGSVIFGGGRIPTTPSDTEVNRSCVEEVFQQVQEIYPNVAILGKTGGEWAGLMPFSVDGKPLVGSLKGVSERFDGLWIAGGFGGEGMMLGPGVAKQLAVCIRTEIDSTLCTTREKSKASELLVDMNPCRTNGVRRTTEV